MALETKGFSKLKWYYQIVVVAGVCGALLAGAWYWYLVPIDDEIKVKEGQLSTLELEVARSVAQNKIYEQFKAETVELGKKLEALKTILPLEKETDQILRTIQNELASSSGVRVMRIGVRPIIDHEVYTEWNWDIEMIGTYNNFESLLDKVRKIPRIFNVSNLKVSSRASEGEQAFTASVGVTFVATTFIYHEEPIATTAPPATPAK